MESVEYRLIRYLNQYGVSSWTIAHQTGINHKSISTVQKNPDGKLSIKNVNKLLQYYCFYRILNGEKDL